MKRRSFLKGTGAAAAAATVVSAVPARSAAARELKMVTAWPKNFPGLGTSAERLAKRIEQGTGGELTVRIFAANELVGPFEAFDAVSQGAADIYHAAEYYWQGKSTAFNFFTAVPFGMTATEIAAWIYHGGGQPLWDELSAKFNIKALQACNTGVQMGAWFKTEINTLEDLKGIAIRMPGLGGEVMRRLGATAVSLPGPEIFSSLQSGAIDATEWVGPWNDLAFGFYKIAKYYYWPGFQEPGASIAAGFNLEVWNSLTPTQRAVIEAACAAENDVSLAEFNHQNARALETLTTKHGVQLRQFSDEVMRGLKTMSLEVVKETGEGGDELTRRIYESFRQSLANTSGWVRIAEEAYRRARRDL